MPHWPFGTAVSLVKPVLRLWVRPSALPDDPASLLNSDTPVLYLFEGRGGLVDRTALSLVADSLQLPDPESPLTFGSVYNKSRHDALDRPLGRLSRRARQPVTERLQSLAEASTAGTDGELQIVPVAIYWGRAPDKESSWFRLLFSEDWVLAGRLRKLITSLLHGRHTLVRFSDPLSLQELLASDTQPGQAGRKLARVLRVHFRQRRMATLGPDQSHRRMLISHVLAERSVRELIAAESAGGEGSVESLSQRAHHYAIEIAADISYPTVRVLHRLLTRLWNELYDGVDVHGIDKLQAVSEGRELVYVPCHRSHIDYLLLSYTLYVHGFSLPHIAAGINLNLPVVGGLLRRGGAFFLRRTFSGNKLYATVFGAYLKEILQRGHAIEYFIEGGRSRSGRLLPARVGMLAMTVQAYLQRPRTPVVFVPVYFGYERLIEGRAFTSELAGGKKQKESLFALVRSLRSLREDYGRVQVSFGEPLALDDLLDQHRPDWPTLAAQTERPGWVSPLVDDLGTQILRNINSAAIVNPISLLATALLATPRGRLGEHELEQQIRISHRLIKRTHAQASMVPDTLDPTAVIAHGQALRFVERIEDPLGPIIAIRDGQSASLTYFRNNILHLIAMPALVAASFQRNATRDDKALQRLLSASYPFVQAELFMESNPASTIEHTLSAMQDSDLIHLEGRRWRRPATGTLEAVSLIRLAETILPTLERYYLTAAVIVSAAGTLTTRQALSDRCGECAERLARTHGRPVNELFDKHLFGCMFDELLELGWVALGDAELSVSAELTRLEHEARALIGEPVRQEILTLVAQARQRQIETPQEP